MVISQIARMTVGVVVVAQPLLVGGGTYNLSSNSINSLKLATSINHPPNSVSFKYRTTTIKKSGVSQLTDSLFSIAEMEKESEKLRSHFIQVLRSRRSVQVLLSVEHGKPVVDPLFQDNTLPTMKSEVVNFLLFINLLVLFSKENIYLFIYLFLQAMESCPKADIKNFKDLIKEENLYLITEAGDQGRLPMLILSMKHDSKEKRPAVVFLHSTNKCKEWLRPLLEAYASRGYVAIAIDSRYHGERATNKSTYRDALISAWKKGDTMPFIYDTVWDLIKLADYLTQREDIDSTRIGITGESLGGMHAWLAAAADTRYSVVVPIIGVQGFRWAIDNDKWQGRVDSIRPLFEEARKDLGKSAIDKEVVEKVWDRIAPGLASSLDSPYTIPTIAPRPLLIVNGAEDPRCPLAGIEIPKLRAQKAYEEAHSQDKFKLIAEPGVGHQMTPLMVKEASDWLDKFLKK
ncbi:putative esterase YitV isoform X1 [Ricinus communis]|uniref:putative esterase YitV isoform X1 n=1 Tax=Ricinus communis TaxID=3988 RepID=UPI00201AEE3E|nr:putative esterase YitV isoform X1 [Ricinus communis]